MDIDAERAEALYAAISDFLESQTTEGDARSPGTLVSALCRVLADAAVGVDADPKRKLEVIAQLTAQAMGINESVVVIPKLPTGSN